MYWLLAAACALVIVLLAGSRLDESAAHAHGHNNSFSDSLLEMLGVKYPIIQGGMMWVFKLHKSSSASVAQK